jgi:hypothetical protein
LAIVLDPAPSTPAAGRLFALINTNVAHATAIRFIPFICSSSSSRCFDARTLLTLPVTA